MAVEIGPALGLTADSSSLVVATGDLKDVASAAAGAQVAADKLVVGTKAVSGGMSKVAYQSRMVAQQLSQVGQQTMATGNFVQALAIQLPDMALGFGAVGIAAGVVAGVALPLLVEWMGSTEAKAVELKDALGRLADIQSGLSSSQDIMKMNLVELYDQYGMNALAVRQYAAALAELQVSQAKTALAQTVLESANALDRYTESASTAFSSGQMLSTAFYNIKTDLGVTGKAAADLQGAFQQLKSAMSFEERAAALWRINDAMKAAGVSSEKLPAELQNAVSEAIQAQIKMADLAKAAGDAATAASRIAGSVPKAGWLDGAISGAASLAATLWDAAAAKAAAVGGGSGGGGQRDNMDYGNSNWAKTSLGFTSNNLAYTPPKTGKGGGGSAGGGGGGGGGSSDRQTNLDALIQSLQTERETVEAWHAEQLASLATFSDAELAAIGGTNEAKIRLEAEYQERLRGLKSGYQGDALSQASTFFGQLQDATQSGTDGMLRISRVAGAAEALINAYVAGSQVLRDPKLSWWQKIPAAFSIIGAGMGMANAIKGGSKSSGSGAAAASSGGSPSGQQSTTTDTPLRVSLDAIDPSASYTGAAIQKMFEAIQKEAGNRGIVWVADGMSA